MCILRYHLSQLYPLLPPATPFPSGNHHTVVCVSERFFGFVFCLILSPFSPSPANPKDNLKIKNNIAIEKLEKTFRDAYV